MTDYHSDLEEGEIVDLLPSSSGSRLKHCLPKHKKKRKSETHLIMHSSSKPSKRSRELAAGASSPSRGFGPRSALQYSALKERMAPQMYYYATAAAATSYESRRHCILSDTVRENCYNAADVEGNQKRRMREYSPPPAVVRRILSYDEFLQQKYKRAQKVTSTPLPPRPPSAAVLMAAPTMYLEPRQKYQPTRHPYHYYAPVPLSPPPPPAHIYQSVSMTSRADHHNARSLKPHLCKYYATSGCHKKRQCPFMHEEFPCRHFHRSGCQYGRTCKYSHAPLTAVTKRLLDEHIDQMKQWKIKELQKQEKSLSKTRILKTSEEIVKESDRVLVRDYHHYEAMRGKPPSSYRFHTEPENCPPYYGATDSHATRRTLSFSDEYSRRMHHHPMEAELEAPSFVQSYYEVDSSTHSIAKDTAFCTQEKVTIKAEPISEAVMTAVNSLQNLKPTAIVIKEEPEDYNVWIAPCHDTLQPSSSSDDSGMQENRLSNHVDAPLHSSSHPAAKKRIKLTLNENCAIYHLYNENSEAQPPPAKVGTSVLLDPTRPYLLNPKIKCRPKI